MKSKKNKINLGTKTRKFYDSFVSFLFNRFNKPKKIIQKGGATANDIKLDFLRALYNKIPRSTLDSSHASTVKNSIITAANELLNEDPYKTPLNDYKFQYNFTDKRNNILKWFKDGLQDPPPLSYPVLFVTKSNETPLDDAELERLFNLSAPAAAPSADESSLASPAPAPVPPANPVPAAAEPLEEQQFYMDFRNEIKQIMGSKPCNDETIGEAGKQLMATDKYKNLAKQYEFNESYILQDDAGNFNGDFLRWFCGDSADPPQGGFPKMFIPLRSNAKGILAAYKDEPEDVAKPEDVDELESKAKVGNGVLGYGTAAALGATTLGTYYFKKGEPAQSTDADVDSSVSSNNTDLQNGTDVISPVPPASSDGSGAESSDASASEQVTSGNGTINGSPTNLQEQTEEQKNQEEQERLEQAFKNPPEGWTAIPQDKNGISFLSRKGNSESSRPEEAWMRKIENGHPVWTKTIENGHAIRNPTVKPSVKPTIEKQNKSETKPLLLLPPPPSPLVQLPGANDSFSGQGGPQIAPRGYTPTYTQVGVGTVALGALAYYLYGRKNVKRDASKTSSKKKLAPSPTATPTPAPAPTATPTPAPAPAPAPTATPTPAPAPATSPRGEIDEDREAVETLAKQLETKKRQKMEKLNEEIKKIIQHLVPYKNSCNTIVLHANVYLNKGSELYRKYYNNKPKAFSIILKGVINFIKENCGSRVDNINILEDLLNEVALNAQPELARASDINFSEQQHESNLPVRPQGRLSHVELSRIDSNGSDEHTTGFSWKQGNPQGPG
jgi:hypothetical protein